MQSDPGNSHHHKDGTPSGTQSKFCAKQCASVLPVQEFPQCSVSTVQSAQASSSPTAPEAKTRKQVEAFAKPSPDLKQSKNFSKESLNQVFPRKFSKDGPVVIELFAGSGRVTAALKAADVRSAFGVDHKRISHVAPIMIADLTTKAGQSLFMTWMEAPNLAGIFAAPPCGTCSLARNIKIRDSKGRLMSGPVPLRSQAFPEGFPHLTHTNLKRVLAANKLYEFLAKVVTKAHDKNLIIVIENPRSSLYWITKYFQKIKHLFTFVAHQACAYGSCRPKWTALAVNRPQFLKINNTCPGESSEHVHKPWGLVSKDKFATAEETAYPPKLAHAIAQSFVQALSADGWTLPSSEWSDLQLHPSFAAMRAITGRQPKASKVPPLVSEHRSVISVCGPIDLLHQPPCPLMSRIKTPWPCPQNFQNSMAEIPIDSQLLRISQTRLTGGENLACTKLVWGMPWSCAEFVEQAVSRGHPRAFNSLLPQELCEAVETNDKMSSADLAGLRTQWFSKWVARAKDLNQQELEFKRSLAPHLQHILQPKRLLLLKEIIEAEGYPDSGVFEELAFGTSLTGIVPWTGVFEQSFKPALATQDELSEQAKPSNLAIFHSVRSSGDLELDNIVFEKTIEERDAGWLRGPVQFEELGPGCVLSRRFGLKQTNKVRLVDDLTKSGINSTVQTSEAPKPHSTDVVASLTLALLLAARGRSVCGKTFDLKSAYRQLGIHPNSLSCSFITCFDPKSRKPAIFQMLAVPFGGSRSVYSFLRIVRVVWWIACKCLAIMWTNFYDDFVTFSWDDDRKRTECTVELLFELLGWQFAREGDKALEFGNVFGALGIQVDLSCFDRGFIEFSNTEKRRLELCQLIDSILASRRLSSVDALKVRGRLQFADGQLFGRIGKLCLNEVTSHAFAGASSEISDRLHSLLSMFKFQLSNGPPRQICGVSSGCFYIFTDACFERDHHSWPCGIGGAIFDSAGSALQVFSFNLSDFHMNALGVSVKRTIIFEAELLAVIVAFVLWKNVVSKSPVVFFVDNNAARDVAISANGRSQLVACMVEQLLQVEEITSCYSWFARVPSPSNPADGPSRNDCEELFKLGASSVDVDDIVDSCIHKLSKFNIG